MIVKISGCGIRATLGCFQTRQTVVYLMSKADFSAISSTLSRKKILPTLAENDDEDFSAAYCEATTFGLHGSWAVKLIWFDANGDFQVEVKSDNDPNADNVQSEILAAICAIREAQRQGLPLRIHSVNEANVKTFNLYMAKWKSQDWTNTAGKPPKNVHLWREIDLLRMKVDISWLKRSKQRYDEHATIDALLSEIEERDAETLRKRAMDKDWR